MDQKDQDTGEIAETPSVSPTETITSDSTEDVNESASSQSPEEVAWDELKGDTQNRIKSILKERDDWKARAERESSDRTFYEAPQQQNLSPNSPEVIDAVQKLSNVGMATKDEVNQVVNQRIGNLVYNFELEKLGNKYDGTNGLPRFERSEY